MRLTLIFLLTLSGFCYGQDYKAQFRESFQANDTLKEKEVLTQWEKADPKNPELFTSYFNYYFQKAKQEVVLLTTDEPKGQSYSLVDSTGKTAGFLGSEVSFNRATLQRGLDKIDQGIKLYPNRLDMRFGKIYALGQVEAWENFTNEIINAIQYSNQNKNEWTWTNNERKGDGKNFFLGAIQDYQVQLYNTQDDTLLKNMATIANEVLKFYPENIESLSNLSITYLVAKEYDKAIEVLLRAQKINRKDAIVLGNIAQGYKLKGDKKKAIEYYEKTIKYADNEMIEYAKKQIEELKK
jgi:tetratricopeptide (TPR) repeat protein